MLSSGNFMVMLVHGQAHFEHSGDHFAANIDCAIHWRNWEITALRTRTVAQIATFIFGAGVGGQFNVIDLIIGCVVAVFEPHIIEHEKFSFWANIDGVTNAGCFQIGLSTLGGAARIAAVKFTGRRLHNVAEQDHHWRR